jgi:hypothetical protein
MVAPLQAYKIAKTRRLAAQFLGTVNDSPWPESDCRKMAAACVDPAGERGSDRTPDSEPHERQRTTPPIAHANMGITSTL